MKIPYNYMSNFLQVGMRANPLRSLAFNRDLTFSFEEYVKSEIHLPGLTQIYSDRDIFEYNGSFEYLFKGKDEYVLDCAKTLRYFYEDMTNVLCNVLRQNPLIDSNITIDCRVSRETKIPYKKIALSEVLEELRSVLEDGKDFAEASIAGSILLKFSYEEFDKLKATRLLALASVLFYYSQSSDDIYLIEVI